MSNIDFYDTSYEIQAANERRNRAMKALSAQQQLANLGISTQQNLADVSRQYQSGLEPRVSSYARRGLGRSGLFQRAMKEYAQAQQRDVGNIYAQQQQGMADIELGQQQADIELQNALDRLRLEKNQRIIEDAARLAQFSGFLG